MLGWVFERWYTKTFSLVVEVQSLLQLDAHEARAGSRELKVCAPPALSLPVFFARSCSHSVDTAREELGTLLDEVGQELELPDTVSLVDYPALVARLKARAIEAGFVLHEGTKTQRMSDRVWTYVLRCECYNCKANRCPFSFKLMSGPVEMGSDPDELTLEAGVDFQRGHNHDLPTPGAEKQQSAGYIGPFVKEVVAAAVKTGIPTGKVSALLAHLGHQKTYGNNELESLRQRTTRQLQDTGFGEIWETLEQIQSAGSLPGLYINRMVNASNEIVAIYVMTPLAHLLRQRFGAVVSSDVTYNTNRYAFYLAIQTVYLAAIGRRAPTSFALIRGTTWPASDNASSSTHLNMPNALLLPVRPRSRCLDQLNLFSCRQLPLCTFPLRPTPVEDSVNVSSTRTSDYGNNINQMRGLCGGGR